MRLRIGSMLSISSDGDESLPWINLQYKFRHLLNYSSYWADSFFDIFFLIYRVNIHYQFWILSIRKVRKSKICTNILLQSLDSVDFPNSTPCFSKEVDYAFGCLGSPIETVHPSESYSHKKLLKNQQPSWKWHTVVVRIKWFGFDLYIKQIADFI